MRLLYTVLGLFIFIGNVSGCSHFKHKQTQQAQALYRDIQLPSVSRVSVTGAINLRLHGDSVKQPYMRLAGSQKKYKELKYKTDGNSVFFASSKLSKFKKIKPITIDLYLPRLNYLDYEGHGNVKAYGVHSQNLYLVVKGAGNLTMSGKDIGLSRLDKFSKGKLIINDIKTNNLLVNTSGSGEVVLNGEISLVGLTHRGSDDVRISKIKSQRLTMDLSGKGVIDLDGMMKLKSLHVAGDLTVRARWVDSSDITLQGTGNSVVQLAGKTKRMYAELKDEANLDGRYLRIKDLFINTGDGALARVNVLNRFNSLAAGHSEVYYYSRPALSSRQMRENAQILYVPASVKMKRQRSKA